MFLCLRALYSNSKLDKHSRAILMTKNPIHNAILAGGYIVLVASVMYFGPRLAGGPDSVLVPIAMLSLFVLSAAVMGYLFLLQPIQMYLDGEKKEAVDLFAKTLATFAVITAALFAILFLLATPVAS